MLSIVYCIMNSHTYGIMEIEHMMLPGTESDLDLRSVLFIQAGYRSPGSQAEADVRIKQRRENQCTPLCVPWRKGEENCTN